MDLDDQEWFYTLFYKKLLKQRDLKALRKKYAEKIEEDRKEIKDLLKRINLIDKNLNEIER